MVNHLIKKGKAKIKSHLTFLSSTLDSWENLMTWKPEGNWHNAQQTGMELTTASNVEGDGPAWRKVFRGKFYLTKDLLPTIKSVEVYLKFWLIASAQNDVGFKDKHITFYFTSDYMKCRNIHLETNKQKNH